MTATTKSLVLASAVLGLVGTIGPANASILNWTQVNGWQGATPGQTSTSANQQALPTATAGLTLTLTSSAGGPMNFQLPAGGTDTIPGFFATAGTTLSTTDCPTATCGTNVMSASNFSRVTIYEFTFTDTAVETFSVMHDDGVSLFASGSNTNLLPAAASAPTTEVTTTLMNLQPGTYNLWYAAANNLPEDLVVNSTPLVPIPGTLPLFATGIAGLGLLWHRKRKAQAVA